ncbi:hypothetical protein BP5796_11007 [Coleophoma crateriformis]|uniref:Phosphatidic acid phosphatase type 2/haloperoxidase domain-containing protein n=1 Tax=Coleophoma crateriformis TaxID=565419 RepID=A0A3D8QLM9_9HELO|nr:hypothetical protein BP5796_11007 [Coleophoma crateriformis]
MSRKTPSTPEEDVAPDHCYKPDLAKPTKLSYWKAVWLDFACIGFVAACILPVLYMPIFFSEQRLIPMQPPVLPFRLSPLALSDFGLPPELSLPRKPELLPTWACAFIVILGPIAVISVFQIKLRSMWDFHAGTIGILKAVVATTFVQVLLKQFMGGARPYFVEVCRPDLEILKNAVDQRMLFFDITACTGNRGDLNIALQSFPSGHTANSFAVALFIALYLNAKLKPFADYGADFWSYIVTILPVLCASLISGSMLISHQHHAYDIVFGMVLGVILGTLAFRSSYAAVLDFRYNHIPLPSVSLHTQFPYEMAYMNPKAKKLSVWDWWGHGKQLE